MSFCQEKFKKFPAFCSFHPFHSLYRPTAFPSLSLPSFLEKFQGSWIFLSPLPCRKPPDNGKIHILTLYPIVERSAAHDPTAGPVFFYRYTAYCLLFSGDGAGLSPAPSLRQEIDLSAGWQALYPRYATFPATPAVLDGTCLEDTALEVSFPGLGDLRESFAEVETSDGSPADLRFVQAEIPAGKATSEGLPSAAGGGETLEITLADRQHGLELVLRYTAFDDCDVITRQTLLTNTGIRPVIVRRLMSNQVDFCSQDYLFTTFNGAWAREFEPTDTPCGQGTILSGSRCGVSSSLANPSRSSAAGSRRDPW